MLHLRYVSKKTLIFVTVCAAVCLSIGKILAGNKILHFEFSPPSIITAENEGENVAYEISNNHKQNDIFYESQNLANKLNNILALENDAPRQTFINPCDESHRACKQDCSGTFSTNTQERIYELLSKSSLTLHQNQSDVIATIADAVPESDIIFISATAENHFEETQAMFENLHKNVYPRIKNFTFILYDLGLSNEHRFITERYCRCKVISFPFERFPSHVLNPHCYSWKPLIVRATIQKAKKLLVYHDASIRWTTNINVLINRAEKYGLQLYRFNNSARIPVQTIKEMFDYSNETSCVFAPYPEVLSGILFYKRDDLIIKAILNPWARCALEAKCMCPINPYPIIHCDVPPRDHRCHRFDQSSLGIVTAKLYSDDIFKFVIPDMKKFFDIKRNHKNPFYYNSTI